MRYIFILVSLFFIGCGNDELFIYDEVSSSSNSIINRSRNNIESLEIGVQNAVKKAYQMTDLQFTPENTIRANGSLVYTADKNYQGLIYSSVKELAQFVGEEVSFHTFMTAVNNPRSKLYTEDVSKSPYHGLNCRAYYGTVCSGLVSYALGFYPRYFADDFPLMECMKEVDSATTDSIKVADVLWKNGHVALITDIVKDEYYHVKKIEISESVESGARRYQINTDEFQKLMNTSFKKIYRYTEIYKNIEYTPIPEFVAVLGEKPVQYTYNDDLCVDKGDKSCYLENEDVVINIQREFEALEVYKDGKLYLTITDTSDKDVLFSNLPYGDYKARLCFDYDIDTGIHAPKIGTRTGGDGRYSDFTYWKVVNTNVYADRANSRIYFNSANATPISVRYCDIHGVGVLSSFHRRILTEEEKQQGFIEVFPDEIQREFPYIRVYFQTDYGRVINTPFDWFE